MQAMLGFRRLGYGLSRTAAAPSSGSAVGGSGVAACVARGAGAGCAAVNGLVGGAGAPGAAVASLSTLTGAGAVRGSLGLGARAVVGRYGGAMMGGYANLLARFFAGEAMSLEDQTKLRNIGISAHIDSGKTTLTERILFYTGRINAIHDVKGKDGVGAKMDHMELEREKGITIQAAATYCAWGDCHINIIDTPGHVDFTVEVERALRVLDGAVLVLCGVSGVQSQSITVDRQMKRYKVPRLAFINKLDRQGANPARVIKDLRGKLGLNACAVQIPVGLEDKHAGAVDVIDNVMYTFSGPSGEDVGREPVPEQYKALVAEKRREIIEHLAEVDEEIEELFLSEEEPTAEQLHAAIRRATIALKFVPVFMGSAYKNRGVQPLLDGVVKYLPNPTEKPNIALDRDNGEVEVQLASDPAKELVALAFKLEESRYGQLTYMRVYQGTLRRGDFVFNVDRSHQRIKVPRLVRLHANEMEDIEAIGAGEICAMFGVDCHSGDTFTGGSKLAMSSMYCPEPVISYSVKPKKTTDGPQFSKALARFTKEDPTFRLHVDGDTNETIISGMGELHLDIYVERMKREYKVEVETGEPRVNYRETITKKGEFSYLHKKQSGGAGQFGRVVGYLEPLENGVFEFENAIIGNAIPPEYISAVRKGFEMAIEKGTQIGHPVQGLRVVLTDGQAHVVDSSELAFKLAAVGAFRQGFEKAGPAILEPIMKVEVSTPAEFQGNVIGAINKRRGQLHGSDTVEDNVVVEAAVPLSCMFGFSTELRSMSQGKAEFTMEYMNHSAVQRDQADQLRAKYQTEQNAKGKSN